MTSISVDGKVAFVTGGLGGIGLSIVKKILENGARGVAIIDCSEKTSHKVLDDLKNTYGPDKVIFIKTDVSNKKELEEAFEKTVNTYTQLDIVVNSAGTVDEVEWKKTVAVNLIAVIEGSYLAMEKYLLKYKSGEEGVIVNIASILGIKPVQSVPIYCVTKHGIVSLGRSLGGEEYYKRYKVRVLTICPGVINTPLLHNISVQNVPLFEKSREDLKELNKIVQGPDYVAETLIRVLNEGRNGSLWVTEEEQPAYEIVIPDRKSMRKE